MNPPTFGIAAYHCQQAIEKLIKGKLIIAGTHFPKTHDLRALGAMAATHYPQWRDLFVACIEWTSWGHATAILAWKRKWNLQPRPSTKPSRQLTPWPTICVA